MEGPHGEEITHCSLRHAKKGARAWGEREVDVISVETSWNAEEFGLPLYNQTCAH